MTPTKINKNLPLVVVFGRTNVGKSTLFNTLVEKRQALVSGQEGTTRDSNHGTVDWQTKRFELVDTGGIIDLKRFTAKKSKGIREDDIQAKIELQAREYLKRADLILFIVDNKTGLLPQDRQMSLILKKILVNQIDKVLLVANKVDNYRFASKAAEFNMLALGEPITISATTGSGTGDLLDLIVKKLTTSTEPSQNYDPELEKINQAAELAAKEESEEESENSIAQTASAQEGLGVSKEEIKVIMIGKPNVGKSSLLNSILGENRVIVSPIPHTTREPQDTEIIYNDQTIRLIDTAGITRKGQQAVYRKNNINQLEKHGIVKSIASLQDADIALLVLDINETLTHQDKKIVEEIVERQKSVIIVANKWDLVIEKDVKKITEKIYDDLPFINFAPVVFVSAKTGSKVPKILDIIIQVADERKKEISPSILNTFLMRIVKQHLPAKGKGTKHPHIHKFEQTGVNPPTFEVRIGSGDSLHFSYLNFISNRLREKFGFTGTPIRLWVRKNRKVHGKAEVIKEGKQPRKKIRQQQRVPMNH